MPPSVSQLSAVAGNVVASLVSHGVPESSVTALRACFPQGAYLSLTMGTTTSLGEIQLLEHSNFFIEGELVSERVPIGASGCATADAIIGNQNFYFDEAIHKDKANQCRDFVRLSTGHDCAAIVAVPLPCHSKVGGDPRAACPHCGKSFMLAGRPLGCLLLGIRRNTNYSVREYLAKLVVFAGCLGPRLLALQQAAQASSSPRTAAPPKQEQPPVANPLMPPPANRPPLMPRVHVAYASSWHTGVPPAAQAPTTHNTASPPPMPRRNSIDVGSLANASSWNPLTSPRTPTTAPPLTTSLAATLPTLPELPQQHTLFDHPSFSADPLRGLSHAYNTVPQRTSLEWSLGGGVPSTTDGRLSLDSQASAASMMMMSSRGSSVDGRTVAALLSGPGGMQLGGMPGGGLGSGSLPPGAGFMTSSVPGSGLQQYMMGGGNMGPLPQLPPSTATMAQQMGLLDLLEASPDKAQLLEALYALQLQHGAGGGNGEGGFMGP